MQVARKETTTTNMSKLILILAIQILLLTTITSATNAGDFAKTVDRKHILKKEKLTHLKVYWHDIISGPNPTAIRIHDSVKNSKTAFGTVTMMDNALTSDVPINSTVVGRSQGFYAGAAQRELGFLMAMNFVFRTGKFNGSTITILGRNEVFSGVREMPVVGGSGMFRFARGYVEARTKWFDQKSGDATVEYNCYVMHY